MNLLVGYGRFKWAAQKSEAKRGGRSTGLPRIKIQKRRLAYKLCYGGPESPEFAARHIMRMVEVGAVSIDQARDLIQISPADQAALAKTSTAITSSPRSRTGEKSLRNSKSWLAVKEKPVDVAQNRPVRARTAR